MRIGLLYKTPNDDDHESAKDLQLIPARNSASFFVSNCRINKFNKSLLISPRVRTTLIVYFQLIMKIFTETDTDVSAVQAKRWTAEKIVRNMLSSWWGSAQRKLGLSVQFLFFAEIARRSLAKQEGGNI